jgi:hypothetical protein
MQGGKSGERMCQLAHVSRARVLSVAAARNAVEEGMELRPAIQPIVLEHRRRHRHRRVSDALRRRGMLANQQAGTTHHVRDKLMVV